LDSETYISGKELKLSHLNLESKITDKIKKCIAENMQFFCLGKKEEKNNNLNLDKEQYLKKKLIIEKTLGEKKNEKNIIQMLSNIIVDLNYVFLSNFR